MHEQMFHLLFFQVLPDPCQSSVTVMIKGHYVDKEQQQQQPWNLKKEMAVKSHPVVCENKLYLYFKLFVLETLELV